MRKRKKEDGGDGEERWSGVEIENIAGGDTRKAQEEDVGEAHGEDA
jgi:hypothetical protein